jgi:hypothetical protein
MKLTRNTLKELIRQSIKEIDFDSQDSFKKYKSQHKMRPDTKVNIGGKETTVGQASGEEEGGGSEAKQEYKDKLDQYKALKDEYESTMSAGGDEEELEDLKGHVDMAKEDMSRAKEEYEKEKSSSEPKGGDDNTDISADVSSHMESDKGKEGIKKAREVMKSMDKHAKKAVKTALVTIGGPFAFLSDVLTGGDSTKGTYYSDLGYRRKLSQIMGESVNKPVSRKRTTVKEVKKWFKTLEENRYKKTYASDARRVSWLVNNNLSEDYEAMPVSMKKKWPKAAYKRERFLAKEFVKHKRNEAKLRESIRGIVNRLITEDQYGATDKKFVPVKVDKYAPNTRESLNDSIRSLSGAAFGFSLSEDSEMDDPEPAKKAHEAYNKWAKGMGVKFQKLYKELDSGWKVYHDTFDKERRKNYKK